MILLLKTSDNCCYCSETPTDAQLAKAKVANFKQGYIVSVFDDNYSFGSSELDTKKFLRIGIDDDDWNEDWIGGTDTLLRSYVLPLDEVLTSQELIDLKAGDMTSHDLIEVEDISEKVQVNDYDNRPTEFCHEW